MKLKLLFCSLIAVLFLQTAMAVNPTPATNNADVETTIAVDIDQHQGFFGKVKTFFKKKIKKVKTFMASAIDIDLQDPVFKWLWYALILLLVSIIISILAAGAAAGGAVGGLGILGLISLIVWAAQVFCWVMFLIKWIPTL